MILTTLHYVGGNMCSTMVVSGEYWTTPHRQHQHRYIQTVYTATFYWYKLYCKNHI